MVGHAYGARIDGFARPGGARDAGPPDRRGGTAGPHRPLRVGGPRRDGTGQQPRRPRGEVGRRAPPPSRPGHLHEPLRGRRGRRSHRPDPPRTSRPNGTAWARSSARSSTRAASSMPPRLRSASDPAEWLRQQPLPLSRGPAAAGGPVRGPLLRRPAGRGEGGQGGPRPERKASCRRRSCWRSGSPPTPSRDDTPSSGTVTRRRLAHCCQQSLRSRFRVGFQWMERLSLGRCASLLFRKLRHQVGGLRRVGERPSVVKQALNAPGGRAGDPDLVHLDRERHQPPPPYCRLACLQR